MLALLAVAALPALAQAEDSSGIQYETEHYESGAKPKKKANPEHGTEPSAEASTKPGHHQETTQPSEGNSEEAKEGNATGAAPNGGGGNNGGGNGSPSKTGTPNGGGNEASISAEKPVGTTSGQNASHTSGGGSSPLVPILIAVAVLAAISIGAVIYRQRRQGSGGSGSPVSPNAG